MEKQSTVLVGVTGCIAAYKSCEIVRGLQKRGCRVKVVMTEHATHFVDPLTFRSLTHEPVAVGLFDDPSDPIHHISLAEEADVFLIAPCTANVAAKMACGIADDLLTTTALACTAPLVVAPAMNVHMYEAEATQRNLRTLKARGARIVEAGSGYLACGDVGRGRLADVDAIVEAALEALEGARRADLAGLSVLVTAGPTEEPVDPVRFLTNRSSGKMGYAVAAAALARGAQVTLVSGPVALEPPAGADVVRVRTACEMLEAARPAFADADIVVFTAAVADLRPAHPADRKLKKGADDALLARIELVSNPDILATLAQERRAGQTVVGFAAETENAVENARVKLETKGADLIVANEVGEGRAFGTDDNQAVLVSRDGERALPLMPKRQLADAILDRALELRAAH
ncbi:MAG TPA: bifunctional phosphopantothenoylcysteine decarboxylase/phosphopantothenate--cysteine ligase CoaBC [Candidatus Aphodovivens avistercoris]|nr:bifunctional phosphopantothenoylcysteine decarboxylase/phosphopantothenate--cysteine ligase CoaBC [Candidatus Aphodovivens avistercoris]